MSGCRRWRPNSPVGRSRCLQQRGRSCCICCQGDDDSDPGLRHRCRPGRAGLVTSLNGPDGNVTGVSQPYHMEPKRLGLLRVIVAAGDVLGVLLNASCQWLPAS